LPGFYIETFKGVKKEEDTMKYKVLSPCGVRGVIKRTPISPRLENLDDKTVYIVAQDRPNFTRELSSQMAKALPKTKVVYRRKPGWIRDVDQELWDEIFNNADALVYGTCMGGGSGMTAITWVREVEKRGIPCVYLAGEIYERDIKASSIMRGMPALRMVIFKLVGEENVGGMSDKQYTNIISDIVKSLTSPLTKEEKRKDNIVTKRPPKYAMTGTFEEVQEHFIGHGWSDGLPIIPPIKEKVKEMLKGTSHVPDEVVTKMMYPEELTVTVEKVAIVGVMAGCKPEYMPLLLSIIENWGSSPIFAQAARSDSTFIVMTIVNGPIRNEIDMNKGSNAMGPGNRANATIGRFLRLAILCLGGSVPGVNDLSAQGNPAKYGFCFPEHEEESPWKPYHVSQGFKKNESVVSLVSGGWCHWGFSSDLDHLARAIANFSESNGATVLMSLEAARLYHSKGMSKEDIEKYLSEHVSMRRKDYIGTWYKIDMPRFKPPKLGKNKKDTLEFSGFEPSIKIIVVGGETSQPIAQAWHTHSPISTSVDKWR
jgi:hypothetical protein